MNSRSILKAVSGFLIASYVIFSFPSHTLKTSERILGNQRRFIVPMNAECLSMKRVAASGLCSGEVFNYKICTFGAYSVTETIIEEKFQKLENFNSSSCLSAVDAVCKRYLPSAQAIHNLLALAICGISFLIYRVVDDKSKLMTISVDRCVTVLCYLTGKEGPDLHQCEPLHLQCSYHRYIWIY